MPFTFQSNALITSEYFSRFFYGVDDASTTVPANEIAVIEALVGAASQQITDYLGRELKKATYREVWDGQGADMVLTKQYPIRSVASVKFAEGGDFANATALSTNIVTFDDDAIYLRDALTPRGRGLIEIQYEAGYDPVPYNVQLATVMQYSMLRKATNPLGQGSPSPDMGYQSISKMGENLTKDSNLGTSGLPAEVLGLISQYKRLDAPHSVMFMRVG